MLITFYKIPELLVAIQRYLSQGPCQEAAKTLKDEIEKNQVFNHFQKYFFVLNQNTSYLYQKDLIF